MLPMVLLLLLAWLVVSVLFAALFSLVARRSHREDSDPDRQLRGCLAAGEGPARPHSVATVAAVHRTRPLGAPSPRRRPEGMAESTM